MGLGPLSRAISMPTEIMPHQDHEGCHVCRWYGELGRSMAPVCQCPARASSAIRLTTSAFSMKVIDGVAFARATNALIIAAPVPSP